MSLNIMNALRRIASRLRPPKYPSDSDIINWYIAPVDESRISPETKKFMADQFFQSVVPGFQKIATGAFDQLAFTWKDVTETGRELTDRQKFQTKEAADELRFGMRLGGITLKNIEVIGTTPEEFKCVVIGIEKITRGAPEHLVTEFPQDNGIKIQFKL